MSSRRRFAALFGIVVSQALWLPHSLVAAETSPQAAELKKASAKAEDEKNYKEAARLLNDYSGLAPNDTAAKLHLGVLCAEAKDFPRAIDILEKGLRAADASVPEADRNKARRQLVEAALALGRYAEAETHLKILMRKPGAAPDTDVIKGCGDAELLELYGRASRGEGYAEKACDAYRRAIDLAPDRLDSYARLAVVLQFGFKREAEADAVIETMVAKNPKSIEALDHYVGWFVMKVQPDAIEKALAKARTILEIAPDEPRGLFLVGQCLVLQRKYDEAETVLLKGVEKAKDDAGMYIQLARAQGGLHKYKEEIETLKRGLGQCKAANGRMEILAYLARMQIVSGDLAAAEKDIQQLRDGGYREVLCDDLEALLRFQQQDWPAATHLLRDKVLPSNPDVATRLGALLVLAKCYGQDGHAKEEKLCLEQAVKIDTFNFEARSRLGEIYQARHQMEEAQEQYYIATRSPWPDVRAFVALARIMIVRQLSLENDKRDWERVDNLLKRIMETWKNRPDVVNLAAEVELAKGHADDAELLLRLCAKRRPKSAETWLALVRLTMYRAEKETDAIKKKGLWEQADAYIDKAEYYLGDGSVVRLARGGLAVHRKDPHVGDVLKKLGEGASAMSDSEMAELWSGLIPLCIEADDLDLARDYCRRLVAREPKNIRLRYTLCELQLHEFEKGGKVDLSELNDLVDEIEHLGGPGPYGLYGKAIRSLVLSQKKDPNLLNEALNYAQDAIAARSDWVAPVVLAGRICEYLDEPDEALGFYQRAIFYMQERDPEVIARAVKLLVARGRIGEAKVMFDYLAKQKSPLSDEMKSDSLYVKIFTLPVSEAEKLVDDAVPDGSFSAKEVAWQGEMYAVLAVRLKGEAMKRIAAAQEQGESVAGDDWRRDAAMLRLAQKGMDRLFRALHLKPDDDVWIVAMRLLVDIGQGEKAKSAIETAKDCIPRERTPLTLGQCYELVGDLPHAREQFEAAAKQSPDDAHVLRQVAAFDLRAADDAAAEPLLRKMITAEKPAAAADLCWARRRLALLLDRKGGFETLPEALELLDDNLRGRSPAAEDLRLKAELLMADPRKEKQDDALAALEALAKRPDATADDRFSLMQFYRRRGDDAGFQEQMRNLLASSSLSLRQAALYVDFLLEHKRFDEAEHWVEYLEKNAPESFLAVQARAEYRFRRNEYHKAAEQVMLSALDFRGPDRGLRIYQLAGLMEKFAQRLKKGKYEALAAEFTAKADTLYESLRSKNVAPNGDLIYAAWLARQKRMPEALAVLEPCWEKGDENMVQSAATSLLDGRAASREQLAQLEKILIAAADKFHRPAALLMLLAIADEEMRQYDKAQGVYREIVAKDPHNVRAMNNLAIELSYQQATRDEALRLIDKAIAVGGPQANLLDSRGLVHLARGEYDLALEDFDAAIATGDDAEYHFHRARALSFLKRKDEAAAAFAKAKEKELDPALLDPREMPAYEQLRSGK